ncbi:MAG: DUF3810 domain-containing protein [Eubacteriales bacterium]|nr:DUF3810 domain-containing protein [Eubacteriales bacterium]
MLIGLLVITLHLLLRLDHALMARLSEGFVHPVHKALAKLCAVFPFSVAEVLICLFFTALLVYIILKLARLRKATDKRREVYIIIMTPLCAAVCVYALFCVMWGTYYYGDDFASKSGLTDKPVSVEQLEKTTRYFAELAGEYSDRVSRNENGVCNSDREKILERSAYVFDNAEKKFPCLAGDRLCAKGFNFSRALSAVDFMGFFFPFTGEANVNTDFPPALLASTAAHELAHQRGVAEEQEANFAAVLACLEYGDPDFVYSAALLAYIHLGNALYEADGDAWLEIYESLDGNVIADLEADRAYWQRFESPVQTVSDTVYEGFLQSYDQELGLESYGACVDLLVNYYG